MKKSIGTCARFTGRVFSKSLHCFSFIALLACATFSQAQVEGLPEIGELIFEDNFDSVNTENWSIDLGDGCQHGPQMCGWGNWELQWYSENNVSIQPVPGEDSNNALVLEARREATNGYSFSSGKLTSFNKIAVKYGVIEARLRTPSVDTGLWPAFWMLGVSPLPWPRKGEIDIMEMGHMAAERDRQGHGSAAADNYVGSNVIFYAEGACADVNPTCAASTAWDVDYNKPYIADVSLADRFVTYRMYWTDSLIAFTIVDNGVETMMYEGPFFITDETDAFREPFYLLLNLAVGGTFTDAGSPDMVSATMPAPMYVDYVRVYEADGQGEIITGDQSPPPKEGPFGVFTDTTPVNDQLVIGVDSDIYLWDPFSSGGSIEPAEGDNVMTFSYNEPGNWFGGGVSAFTQPDMSAFADGVLRFKIKIPANVAFRIGVTDNYTNANYIEFPANETKYGLVRDGEWGQVEIPISELRGTLIALQNMNYLFAIVSVDGAFPTEPFEYAIDDIVWDNGGTVEPDSDGDGVRDSVDLCPNTPAGTAVDENGCALPLDSDNDGVVDSEDECPNTAPGVPVDATGCEIISNAEVQTGTVSFKQEKRNSWTWVNFDSEFNEAPIVVVGAPSTNGEQPVTVRVRNISTSGFEIQMREWSYQDGTHKKETMTYIAMSAGTQNWNGVQVVAGEMALDEQWSAVSLETAFDSAPVVLATQVSANGGHPTTVRIRNIDGASFEARLQEEEAGGNHKVESVHFIAMTEGEVGNMNGLDIYAGKTHTYITEEWYGQNLVPDGFMVDSTFMAGMQTTNDEDTATVRYRGLEWNQVKFKIQEEKSLDKEVEHEREVVGYFVMGEFAWADYDLDGVKNNLDQCPNTPFGVEVDEVGCEIIEPVDSDNDGVTDDLDQCPNTPPAVVVDTLGCPLPIDSDGDGVEDEYDLCPDTVAGAVVDADGCEIVQGPYGLIRVDDNTALAYINSSDWGDLHYIVNGGPQLNVRMTQTGTRNEFTITGLTTGDTVEFSFTYWYPEGPWAEVAPWQTYTH